MNPEDFEARLAESRYLDDDGFTARVLARLPPPRRSYRGLILFSAGAVSSAIVFSTPITGWLAPLFAYRPGAEVPVIALAFAAGFVATVAAMIPHSR